MAADLFDVLSGVGVGAVLGFTGNFIMWKIQHRDAHRDYLEQEQRRARSSAAEKFLDSAGRLVELVDQQIVGAHLDQPQLTTLTYLEMQRLRREFQSILPVAREAFPGEGERLRELETQLSQMIFRNPSPDAVQALRKRFQELCSEIRKKV